MAEANYENTAKANAENEQTGVAANLPDSALSGDAVQGHPAFDEFVDTIAALRAPDGCPWDKEQTHLSIAPNMIEEAYEAVDAIEHEDIPHLREELGDVLLQVVLQSQIAADNGEFTIDDVCAEVNAKMVRRHPHVFGDAKTDSANEVLDVWDKIKLAEQAEAVKNEGNGASGVGSESSLLDSVPSSFPALTQALKISRKAASCGFEWQSVEDVWSKVSEEIDELKAAYSAAEKDASGKVVRGTAGGADATGSGATNAAGADTSSGAAEAGGALDATVKADAVEEELGDVLFSLVNVGRKMGVNPENALRRTCIKFRERWKYMERVARDMGENLEDMPQNQMEGLWQQAKQA